MPTQRDRELARARSRRQAERRAAAARRRRITTYVVSAVLVVAIVGVIVGLAMTGGSGGKKSNTTASSPSATPSVTPSATTARTVACGAKAPAAPVKQTYAKEPAMTIDTKAQYVMKMDTSCGEIDILMDAAKTPHTVNSFAFLASKHYFDGIHFSRSVSASQGFAVLQGGDQSSDGTGTPGYNIPDENLKGAKYTRGTVAMANTGQANTGGSQFFLIDQTTTALAPSYTPFGTITKGLDVLDKLLAIGNDGSNQAGGGVPKQTIYINTLTVTKV
jgi:peptidyl-prolyl cis-trans isomerase B (cyclophilin B)